MKSLKYTFLTVSLICMFSLQADAQSDKKWWQKLFKKETVESQPKVDPNTLPEVKKDEVVLPPVEEVEKSIEVAPVRRSKGEIKVVKAPRISELETKLAGKTTALKGYRIQIFFGEYNNSRQQRVNFLSEYGSGHRCHLVQNPPNFSVRVGDFLSKEDAFEFFSKIKGTFPNAYIVQDTIEPPSL